MLSLNSGHRARRGAERKGSDDEALASGVSGINMDSMSGGESHSYLHPATTMETRVTGGLPNRNAVHGLPAGQVSIQNGIVFEEERLNHL